ncbi:MAG: hypothetical protein IKV45_01850, partial [Firmicutes bacterium]|nr:hypothetical protein [Bacillota bacterium]
KLAQLDGKTIKINEVLYASDTNCSPNEKSSIIGVDFAKGNNGDSVTLELQKKEGNGYVTQTTVLASVDGNTSADQGVFKVNGSNHVNIRLSSNADHGTYRLLFKIENNDGIIEVPYHFIVLDK